jgi:hydroxyacylglutathione hydrolase
MTETVRTLALRMSNAYLVRGDTGFVLVDTGFRFDRSRLEGELRAAGCGPGDLRLIVITHGDPDHSSNAAYVREAFGAKIAMHRAEAPAVERGDMFLSRGTPPLSRRLLKPIAGLFRLRRRERFTPDLFLEDGDRLDDYGLDATVLHVPGHSAGSIAVLTADGALFSGDFLENRTRPSLATLVDDAEALKASFERVRQLDVRIVYPGHGRPFTIDEMGGGGRVLGR